MDVEREVADLVRNEQEYCAFLAFDLRKETDGMHLTITAPTRAAEAADMLFDHFAPDMARTLEMREVA